MSMDLLCNFHVDKHMKKKLWHYGSTYVEITKYKTEVKHLRKSDHGF